MKRMVGFVVPRSQHGDSDDVVVSLETARVQAEKSNRSEALRWIRRAARAAESSGDPKRAANLARAAAELAQIVGRGERAGAHAPVPDSEQSLPRDFDTEFEDKTSVDRQAVSPSEPPPSDDSSEDPTEPRRRVNPTAVAASGVPLGFQQVQALRVAVDPLVPGSKILVVHLLGEGESPADGQSEAVLVPADPGRRLLSKG